MAKQKYNQINKHKEVYNELAERRTVKMLGLTEQEVLTAKVYETTKAVELTKIKNEAEKRKNQYMEIPSFWSFLFKKD